eukprot:TRINITY_DN11578_c0_g1_i1.p1 TRINITY_DN11578_c0_g1~~TRINITY_DN11578_c0_g1_i1.p1  ORF type:complete len:255 (-),score=30.23 TRINITY_DN11578_c0_g1_i1:441-1130(-)
MSTTKEDMTRITHTTHVSKSGWGPWRKRRVHTETHTYHSTAASTATRNAVLMKLKCSMCGLSHFVYPDDFHHEYERPSPHYNIGSVPENWHRFLEQQIDYAVNSCTSPSSVGNLIRHDIGQLGVLKNQHFSFDLCPPGQHYARLDNQSLSGINLFKQESSSSSSRVGIQALELKSYFVVCRKCGLTNCILVYPTKRLKQMVVGNPLFDQVIHEILEKTQAIITHPSIKY